MKKMRFSVEYALLCGVLFLSSCTGGNKTGLSNDEVTALAREAYLFVTPLVYTDVTRVSSPVPDNRLHVFDGFPDHTFRQVVAPNNDTNYSIAFLDLNGDAVVIELPGTEGRYFVFPLQDVWTNNFFLPGKRITGTGAQKYLVTPPGWTGETPEGLTRVESPSRLVWVIGRVQVNSPEDLRDFVLPLQRRIVLKPLSAWLDGSEAAVDPQHPHRLYGDFLPDDAKGKPVVEIVRSIPVEDFFNYANALLADNPPFEADSAIVRRIAAIGVGAGLQFSLSAFDPETQETLKQIPADVYAEFEKPLEGGYFGKVTFDPAAKTGDYRTDYNLRALVAYRGLGALPPEEAIYYSYYADKDGEPLNGQNRYRIRFGKGQLPPAQSFWSYTVYGEDRYLVENPIRRYAIGDRNALQYNTDGSLDIYLSRESPGRDRESNWLPTGDKEFNLTLRIYTPTEELLNDRSAWNDPKPEKIN
ncbi:MAG: DUF1254 domain-containing protein [Tannerella sp.]|jgi:hypothetical protein|nr:DUF1254 domain-containing protein [Tannerella sp.]